MIGNDDRVGSLADRSPGIFRSQDSFDDKGAAPNAADPAQVLPRDGSGGKSRADINERHCTPAWNDDVGKLRDAAVEEKAGEPYGMRQQLWKSTGPEEAARTSSMECPEILERMYIVPAAPAAREAAISPPGCMTRL